MPPLQWSADPLMSDAIGKVTAFITRTSPTDTELLLFEHPYAGIQIPAGTVEPSESPREAVLREAAEETGLTEFTSVNWLDREITQLPHDEHIILTQTTLYARPDRTSFDWVTLPRGIPVKLLRREAGFSQVAYEEPNRFPDPQYVSMAITGWVLDETLTDRRERHFFHLKTEVATEDRWTTFTDNHHFTLFWVPVTDLPEIVHPQNEWLKFLPK